MPGIFDNVGPFSSAGECIAGLASHALAVGVKEQRQNRGPRVDEIIRLGGGNPESAPPWCAYFVSAVLEETKRRGHCLPAAVKSGRAVNHWLKAPEHFRIQRDDIWDIPPDQLPGLVFVRTRTSKPTSERDKVLRGMSRTGHTGIVIGVGQTGRELVCIAGNSSGSGHSRVSGSGSVAIEVYTEGSKGWARMVGFSAPAGLALEAAA